MRQRKKTGIEHQRLALLAMVLVLFSAGCSSGASAQTSATATPNAATVSPQASSTGAPTATPGITPITTPGGQVGDGSICTEPVNVAVQLPATIPNYPNSQLRYGVSNPYLFGICSHDSVATVTQFYLTQLPLHGWQQVAVSSFPDAEEVTGSQNGIQVLVFIEQDQQASGQSQITIQITSP